MSKVFVSGKIIKKYKIPLDQINELNIEYDSNKKTLLSKSDKLAGRLQSELDVVNLIKTLPIMETIKKCMHDYIMSLNNFDLIDTPQKNLNILSIWINDMQPHEYNPPHTHHDKTGWSTVMFLKTPKFIDDTIHKHKFKDGSVGFAFHDNTTKYFEPVVGDFYIFEASHQHFVFPYKTNDKDPTRRSMSFNFVDTDVQ